MNKKVAYFTHMRLPTEKAYGVQMVNTLKGLSNQGAQVELITTYNKNPIKENIFGYYGIDGKTFNVKVLPALRILRGTRAGFWLNMLSFSVSSMWYFFRQDFSASYSREPFPLFFLGLLGHKTLYEMHDFPEKNLWFHKLICHSASNVAVTNEWARKNCIEKLGLREDKVLLVPNGYDETRFTGAIDKLEARKQLGFGESDNIVLYSGHLYDWKGADVIYEVAKQLPEVTFIFVGGNEKDKERITAGSALPNTIFFDHQRPLLIPTFLAAADILVLPNVPTTSHSVYSTSPIKLFEYMAMRRPIIASNLPSILSLVSGNEVVFAEPGDVSSWVGTISSVFANMDKFDVQVDGAFKSVKEFSWNNKAKKIVDFLKLQ